jgi:hypothetical protein
MTNEQRNYVCCNPNFWVRREPHNEASSKGADTFDDAGLGLGGNRSESNKKPSGATGHQSTYSKEADATADRIKKLRVEHDGMDIDPSGGGVKQEHDEPNRAEHCRTPNCIQHLKTNIGKVFRGWSYVNAPYFKGEVGANVRQWLNTLSINLKNLQAHPNVWHLGGIRLLQGKAYSTLLPWRLIPSRGASSAPGWCQLATESETT